MEIEDNNKDVILLPEKLFKARFVGRREFERSEKMLMRKIRIKEEEVKILGNQEWQEKIKKEDQYNEDVVKTIDTIKTSGSESLAKGLKEWNIQDGIILYRGKVYIPKDQELRREIVKEHHDSRLGGHSERYKTTELIQQNYWWPGMTTFIKNYVDRCAICQESKVRNHPGKEPLHPTEIPEYAFHMINIDFIMDLPSCRGKDSICVITDYLSKSMIVEPCEKTITADETMEIILRRVFSQREISKKIISDRRPQFASRVMKSILGAMGVRSALSTAYHPQTNGAVERLNQELEQYLRVFCNRNQDNWVELLPYAELSHNHYITHSIFTAEKCNKNCIKLSCFSSLF
jgi:hypothetical protein